MHTTLHVKKPIHPTRDGLLDAKGLRKNANNEKKCEIQRRIGHDATVCQESLPSELRRVLPIL